MFSYSVVDIFVFFFSSRRRHTRSLCDWSSDVCSSDLGTPSADPDGRLHLDDRGREVGRRDGDEGGGGALGESGAARVDEERVAAVLDRRRVGAAVEDEAD